MGGGKKMVEINNQTTVDIWSRTCLAKRKCFQVCFVGENGGLWLILSKRSQGASFSLGFEKEEIEWFVDHLKKASKMDRSLGFNCK